MQLNQFDPAFPYAFIQVVNAPINPKRPDQFLSVAHTTSDPLPKLAEFQIALRNAENTQWSVVDDYRGDAWNTQTRELIRITEFGPLANELSKSKPEEFDEWDGAKWLKNEEAEKNSRIAIARKNARDFIDKTLSKPIEFDGVLFDYDQQAKASILETIEEAQILAMNDSESTGWRLADNTTRNTSVADLKEIVKIGALRRRDANDQYTAWTKTDMQTAFELTL